MLRLFYLHSDRHVPISSYSKGMRQKILLSAALMHNPDLVLLDEPFSGLDVGSALVIRSLIQELAARGKVVLFSSHELETVERVCSHIVILHRGKIVADDSIERLRTLMSLPTLEEHFFAARGGAGYRRDLARNRGPDFVLRAAPMKRLPFRVLYRQFLLRIIDLDLIAPQGDVSKLLGQFAALLADRRLWVVCLLVELAASIPAPPELGLAGRLDRGTLSHFLHHAGGGIVRGVELGVHVSGSPRRAGALAFAGSKPHAVSRQSGRGGHRVSA